MAARKRRTTTRAAAGLNPRLRLALLVGANLAALAVLWQLMAREPAGAVRASQARATQDAGRSPGATEHHPDLFWLQY